MLALTWADLTGVFGVVNQTLRASEAHPAAHDIFPGSGRGDQDGPGR